jgi:hypothetical protein
LQEIKNVFENIVDFPTSEEANAIKGQISIGQDCSVVPYGFGDGDCRWRGFRNALIGRDRKASFKKAAMQPAQTNRQAETLI